MAILNNTQFVDRTGAINQIPFKPNLMSVLGLFREESVIGDKVTFDKRDNTLVVLNDELRNVDKKNGIDPSQYKQHLLSIPHYPAESTVTLNQLKGIRNFDTDVQQSIENAVTEHLEIHTERHDNHLEYLRAEMLCKGQIITTNFGTIDMFTEFDVTKQTAAIDFADATALEPQFRALTNKIKKAYKGGRFQGYVILAGATWFDSFVNHADIREGYVIQGQNSPLRNQLGEIGAGYNMFTYGNITVIQYDDVFTLPDGSTVQPLADDEAVLVPKGNLGRVFFGSVSTLSGIGSSGQKRYASTYKDPKDRYVEVESEQNTLVVLQEIAAAHYLTIKA